MAYNYIITTDDLESANEKIEEIKKSIKVDFDMSSYDLAEDGLYSIADELSTISLFDNPKFMVVKSAEELAQAKPKPLMELLQAMNDNSSQNVCVFLFTKGFDESNENLQKIKKYSSTINIKVKDIHFDEYVVNSMTADGYTIKPSTVSMLVSYVDSLSGLKNAISKLKCYKLDKKEITDQDVKLLITPPLDNNVFELVDAVIKNDKKKIFASYNDLKYLNIQPSYLVTLLINKFQEMYDVAILAKNKAKQEDIASLYKVSSGRAYYMLKNAKDVKLSVIKDKLNKLNKLDYDIKTSRIDQTLGLELFLLE